MVTWALLYGMSWARPAVEVAAANGGTVLRCGCTDTDQCAGAEYEPIRRIRPAVVVAVAWRHLVPSDIRPAVGFHSARLPEYPGRAPVPWAILRRDRTTENTMLYLVDEPDAGPIIDRRTVPVSTAAAMNQRMGETAAEMLERHLPALLRGENLGLPQDRTRRGPLTRANGWALLAEAQR